MRRVSQQRLLLPLLGESVKDPVVPGALGTSALPCERPVSRDGAYPRAGLGVERSLVSSPRRCSVPCLNPSGGCRREGRLTPCAFIFSCFHLFPSFQCFSSSLDDNVSLKSRGLALNFLLPAPWSTPRSCPPREGAGSGLSLMPPGEDCGNILRHCLRTGVLISWVINSVYRGSEPRTS